MTHSTSDSANQVDRQIDLALMTIGGTEPSPSFHERLLDTLRREERQAPPRLSAPGESARGSGRFGWWHDALRIALPAGLAIAAAAMILFALSHFGGHRRLEQQVYMPSPAAPQASLKATPQAPEDPGNPQSLARVSAPASSIRRFSRSRPAATPEAPAGTSPGPDAKAAADLEAPSQLAPPLPVTAQERLVRLMLRRGEKVQLAKLDAARDPDLQREELAAFHNFFDPPSMPQEEASSGGNKPAPATPPSTPQP